MSFIWNKLLRLRDATVNMALGCSAVSYVEDDKMDDDDTLVKLADLRLRCNKTLQESSHKYKSKDSLRVHVCTWNVADMDPPPPAVLVPWLRASADNMCPADIIAIGLQEVDMGTTSMVFEKTCKGVSWEPALYSAVNMLHKGHYYERVCGLQLVGLFLCIYVRRQHFGFVRNVRTCVSRTGALQGVMGNKGAIGARLTLYHKRFLFINAHLAPHEENQSTRNKNYFTIINQLKFELPPNADDETDMSASVLSQSPKRKDVSVPEVQLPPSPRTNHDRGCSGHAMLLHDYVFFFGDLNYRVWNVSVEDIRSALESKDYTRLLHNDQLRQTMIVSDAFRGFTEPDVTFPPTYKFVRGEDFYDTEKHIPSWTDRVLYYCLSEFPGDGMLGDTNSVISYKSCQSTGTPPTSTPPRSPRPLVPMFSPTASSGIRRVGTVPVNFDSLSRAELEKKIFSDSPSPHNSHFVKNYVEPQLYTCYPVPGSDHRPVTCAVHVSVVSINQTELRRVLTSLDLGSSVEQAQAQGTTL